MGPSHKAIMATNLESPFPIASFLYMYLANFLKVSKMKKDISDAPIPRKSKLKSINLLFEILININPKNPNKKPKFIKP